MCDGFGELVDSNTLVYDEYECTNEDGEHIPGKNQTECENIPQASWDHQFLSCGTFNDMSGSNSDICDRNDGVGLCCTEPPPCNIHCFLIFV